MLCTQAATESAAPGLRPRWGPRTTLCPAGSPCLQGTMLPARHRTQQVVLSTKPPSPCRASFCIDAGPTHLHKLMLHAVNLIDLDHQLVVLPHSAGALEDGPNFIPQGHQTAQDPHIHLQEGQCMLVPQTQKAALAPTGRPACGNQNPTGATKFSPQCDASSATVATPGVQTCR